jgi:hypothetical protein
MNNTPITDELARQFAGKRLSSREAGSVWSLCRDLERELAEVTKQRDTLAEACSTIEHAYLEGSDSEWGNALMDIRQALAATKGGSHE